MYADPALIRKNVVKLSLSDPEKALLESYCNYTGGQLSVLVREMVMKQALSVMHELDFESQAEEKRGAGHARFLA